MSSDYSPICDGDQYHNDEVTVIGNATIRGQALDRINLVEIDYEAAAKRNIGYIRENIARRQGREKKSCEQK